MTRIERTKRIAAMTATTATTATQMLTDTNPDVDHEQEEYLRKTTQYYRGLEKPLKFGPSVNNLNDLIYHLYQQFSTKYVNIEMVNHLMLAYKSNPKEWQKFAKFDRYKYTRNLVDAGNGRFNLMILCWGEGHQSSIHDHANSHCFMKILQGELKEIRYAMPSRDGNGNSSSNCNGNSNSNGNGNGNDNGKTNANANNDMKQQMQPQQIQNYKVNDNSDDNLEEIGQSVMALNDVAYINDNLGLHRVENTSHSDTAVSLHLYCPPFNSCSIFEKTSGQRIQIPMTFWSKYGQRVNYEK